jgi:crossover junction endodeoxyribonuclease RuvC
MIILGIDPGSVITGYGVIDARGRHCELVDCGVVRTSSRKALADRLKVIYDGLCEVIDRHRPELLAIETAFAGRFPKAALVLGHARGVALLAAANRGLQVWEYAPREVKMAIVGEGGASKQQVQFMVRAMLNLNRDPMPEDASDAVAVALCHNHRISGRIQAGDRIRRR